jgi:hypothetical protein
MCLTKNIFGWGRKSVRLEKKVNNRGKTTVPFYRIFKIYLTK